MKEFDYGEVLGWGRSVPLRRSATATLDRPVDQAAVLARSFVDALAARDYPRIRRCLDPDVRMRALLPSGLCERAGAGPVTAQFREWFGSVTDLALVDSTVDRIGRRVHVRWRLRGGTAAPGTRRRVVEQHAYIDATDRIHRLDLLLSEAHRPGDDG